MKRNVQIAFLGLFCCLLAMAGCEDPMLKHEREMQFRQAELERKNALQADEIQKLQANEKELQTQVDTLKKIGDKRPDEFVKITRMRISSYTGGVDRDGKPGHDAVKVMFTPEDSAGDPVKTAGTVKIELFNLAAAKPADKLLGTFNYTPGEAVKSWAGGMFTNHYSFILPLPKTFKGGELTVRVEFTDYFSGKTFSGQKVCKIRK